MPIVDSSVYYRILDESGFGVVYKVRDTQQRHRLVAIKQIDLGAISSRQISKATNSSKN